MYIYIISFKNSFSSDLQRVRKSRKSVIQHAFFDAILFDSWNFWNLLNFTFFPPTIFYLDRIFAIDMTGRLIRIYKRWR